MKKIYIIFLTSVISLIITASIFAQTSGDFGSAGNGDWGATGTNWVVCGSNPDWSDATAATRAPGTSDKVWIRNGHTVNLDASRKVISVTIVSGGTLTTPNNTNTLTLTGDLKIDGTCGSSSNAPLMIFGASGTISGSGTFYFARIRPSVANVKVTLDMDGTGTVGLAPVIYANVLNNFTFELKSSRTVTLPTGGYIAVGGSNTSDPSAGANLTINIYGTITVPCGTSGGINLANKTGFTTTLNVYNGGTVNTGRVVAQTGGGADANALNVYIFSGGTINLTTGSPSPITNDMTKANMNIQGAFNPGNTGTMISVTLGNVILNNSSTGVTFSDPTTVVGLLTLTSGKITLKNNLTLTTLSGGSSSNYFVFDAVGTGSVALNVSGTSPWLLPVGTATNYTPLTLQYPVAPTAGKITLSKVTPDMNIIHNISPAFNDGGYSIGRRSSQYWSYTNTASGSSYTLSIDGSSSQVGITDPPNLRIIHSTDGTTFDVIGTHSTGSGSTANRINIPDGTSGRFYLGGQNNENNPLPVELSTFTSNVNGRDIQLSWTTKTEKNSNKFEIQRSSLDNLNWAVIGNVKAAVLSNSPKQYFYSDTKLQSGKYQYRLKMIDNDGSFSYSTVEIAEVAIPKDFALSQNYPNPFNPTTKIDYQVPVDAKVIMEIYNITGQKVIELVNQDQSAGYYTVDFGSTKLSSGVYIYRLAAFNKATGNNFSSIKKMMFLK